MTESDRPQGGPRTVYLHIGAFKTGTPYLQQVLRARHEGPDPEEAGVEAARLLLEEQGGRDLLST